MASRPRRTTRTKALRLASWNADGIRGMKQERNHFLGLHGIDACLLIETHYRSGDFFRLPNNVCHRYNRLTEGVGTGILVRNGENPGDLPVTLPVPNCLGPFCVLCRGPSRPHGG